MSEDVIFCGVFDDHGPHDHLIAHKVRDALSIKMLLFFLCSCESRQNGIGKTCFKGGIKPESGEPEKWTEFYVERGFLEGIQGYGQRAEVASKFGLLL